MILVTLPVPSLSFSRCVHVGVGVCVCMFAYVIRACVCAFCVMGGCDIQACVGACMFKWELVVCVFVCLNVCGSEERGGSLSIWRGTKQNVCKQARDLSASWPTSRRNNAHTNAEGQYRRDYVTDSQKDLFSSARTHSLFGSSLVAPRAHVPEEDGMTRKGRQHSRIAGKESLLISVDVRDQGALSSKEECGDWNEGSGPVVLRVSLQQRLEVGGEREGVDVGGRRRGDGRGGSADEDDGSVGEWKIQAGLVR